MRRITAALLLTSLFVAMVPGIVSARNVVDFCSDWRFSPEGWDGVARTVSVPHDFQMEMPWRKEAGGELAVVWPQTVSVDVVRTHDRMDT
jgi:hypothetical protein